MSFLKTLEKSIMRLLSHCSSSWTEKIILKKVITNHAVTDTYYVWKIIFYADGVLVGTGGVLTHTNHLND